MQFGQYVEFRILEYAGGTQTVEEAPRIGGEMNENVLLGKWRTAPKDAQSSNRFGKVTLEFFADRSLRYTISLPDKRQIMNLTWRVEDGLVVTDQPSHARVERTPFQIDAQGNLNLYYGGEKHVYIRIA